mmetsp:Transcript_12630/g.27277  ORF Transcript_12630/g.27277 Transcript_12630/m.27277 type:complete len:231 (-) Transcript_12630:344-1036(-)|eukprot:CAMPEP_0183331378 /NCGR_PEP_ID=MMETSP0164_2-20130417/731_1 /TAXON_ID=221442 /ORGANISM="Coccolithus pelagicus ssp braarudi, Strain PLY182g" /LENGTH=230 /DNA_ID=CAMNT_0025499829 /DNA_START=40 /DNA_END=732 /DNA_ORIENTATION=-
MGAFSLVVLFGSAAALQTPVSLRNSRPAVASRSTNVQAVDGVKVGVWEREANGFDAAMAKFKDEFPWLAKYGFGPTVKSERWNGRHAMFGWVCILATVYAEGHGLFPKGDVPLTYNEWGGLAQIGFNQYISNERAIIMIAHVHLLMISAMAAFGPDWPAGAETLLLMDGAEDEEPYGLIPPITGGLSRANEMLHGRFAMFGLIATVLTSVVSGKDIIEVVNIGTGGIFSA